MTNPLSLDLDLDRLGLVCLGTHKTQNTLLIGRVNVVCIHVRGKPDVTSKTTVHAFFLSSYLFFNSVHTPEKQMACQILRTPFLKKIGEDYQAKASVFLCVAVNLACQTEYLRFDRLGCTL